MSFVGKTKKIWREKSQTMFVFDIYEIILLVKLVGGEISPHKLTSEIRNGTKLR